MDRVQAAGWAGAAIGIAMMLLGLVGEVLHWWHDTGELLGFGGFALTVLSIILAIGFSASRHDVREVGRAVHEVGEAVHEVGEAVHEVGRGVQDVGRAVQDVRGAVDATHAAVDDVHAAVREGTSRLEAKLDEQTALLRDIRDRLPAR